jgi:hypothetical protein
MPKYRLLTLDELNEMEKEFVNFLVVNSIMPDDWERLKIQGGSNVIIEQFSDVVFETIMRKVVYLECHEEKNIMTYHCLAEKIILVCMTADPCSDVNFSDPSFLRMAFQNPPESLRIYTSEKAYSKEREVELFEMIEAGCTISDGKLFKSLSLGLMA